MSDLTAASSAMAVALLAMMASVAHPTPWTIGMFLGLGLSCGTLGLVFFARAVVRDLRRRKAL